jgi:hypothetical protein
MSDGFTLRAALLFVKKYSGNGLVTAPRDGGDRMAAEGAWIAVPRCCVLSLASSCPNSTLQPVEDAHFSCAGTNTATECY